MLLFQSFTKKNRLWDYIWRLHVYTNARILRSTFYKITNHSAEKQIGNAEKHQVTEKACIHNDMHPKISYSPNMGVGSVWSSHHTVSGASKKKLVFAFHFGTSLSSLMIWNLQRYPTTVLNERKWHFKGVKTHYDPSYIYSGQRPRTPRIYAPGGRKTSSCHRNER